MWWMNSEDIGAAPQDRLPIDSSIRLEQIAAGLWKPFLDKFLFHYILVLNFFSKWDGAVLGSVMSNTQHPWYACVREISVILALFVNKTWYCMICWLRFNCWLILVSLVDSDIRMRWLQSELHLIINRPMSVWYFLFIHSRRNQWFMSIHCSCSICVSEYCVFILACS